MDSVNDLSKVKDWLNQVYAHVCVEEEVNITSATMTLTSGTASYTLPSAVLRIKEMVTTPVGSVQNRPLIQTDLDYILTRRQSSGGTAAALGWVTHYALLGLNDLEVWPTPQSADTITIYYVALPTALSADGDVPILQEPYASKVLEFGALAEAADFKSDPAVTEYRQMFETWRQRYRSHLTRRQGMQPGQFRVLSDSQFPVHDPSSDVREYR